MILGGGTEPSFYKDSPALFVGSDVLDFLYSLVLRVIQLFPLWLLKLSCFIKPTCHNPVYLDTQFHSTVKEMKLFNGRSHDHDSQSQKENVSVS